jgi:hypothetical protein
MIYIDKLFLFLRWSVVISSAFQICLSAPVRVRPSDAAWPSSKEWEQLKKEVGGRLFRTTDPLANCRKNSKTKKCFQELVLMKNPFYVQNHPGGTETSGWFQAWDSSRSQYVVAAKTVKDIVATINFARKKNLRLVVKGGAHSYLGQSNAPHSLLLWTKNMNKITLHKTFSPKGCKNLKGSPAATLETGAIWLQAYEAITTRGGRYVQGGGCTTVGVGGFIQMGGFGSFSKKWGLGASNLLEAEIVTSDGKVLIANACTNPDLFWALKGGGPSFGILTKITLKTHTLPKYFGSVSLLIKARSDNAYKKLLSQFFFFYRDHLLNPYWGENVRIHPNNNFEIAMVCQGLTEAQAKNIWKPFIEWVKKQPGDFEIITKPHFTFIPSQKWWDYNYRSKYLPASIISDNQPHAPKGRFWWAGNDREVDVYLHAYDSAWLPEKLLSDRSLKRFIQTLFESSRWNDLEIHFQKGLAGAPKNVIEAAQNTPINPIAHRSFGLLISVSGQKKAYKGIKEHEPNVSRARKGVETVKKSMALIRSLIPNAGAYGPESDFFARNWQERAWGPHYKRLLSIKRKYDPVGLFVGRHYVGSEFWSTDGFTKIP